MAGAFRPLVGGLIGGVVAGAVNTAVAVAASAAGAPIVGAFGGPGTAVVAFPVFAPMVASVVPVLFAWLVWLGLTNALSSGAKVFVGVAVVFGLVSMGGPMLTLEGASTTSKLLLAFMHLPAAVGITAGVVRGAAARKALP